MNEEKEITDVERVWRERWRPIVIRHDGGLDLEQLKKELYDFSVLMRGASLVYEAATGGKASKVTTDPSVIIALFNDNVTKTVDDALAERDE